MKPYLPSCDAIVTVRVQSAFLACGRPLPPNPVARMRSGSDGGAVLATTQAIAFTQSPSWAEDLQFVVPAIHSARTTLQLEIVDAFSGSFLGAVNALPFNTRWPQRTTRLHRLMLTSRSSALGGGGKMSEADQQLLRDAGEDDFGHVEVAWDVQLCPIGPGPEELGATQQSSLPLSCTLRAQWIGTVSSAPSQNSLVAHLGSSTQAVSLHAETPLVALLRSEAEATIRITCRYRTNMRDEDVGVAHFVVPTRVGTRDHELTWCLPVTPMLGSSSHDDNATTSQGALGMVIISLRLSSPGGNSSNNNNNGDSSGQNDSASAAAATMGSGAGDGDDDGETADAAEQFRDRAPPNTGFGPYRATRWVSQHHLARASERRWKKSVVNDAKPRPNHVRHLLDVMAGRCELHPAVAPHLREYNNSQTENIKELCAPHLLRPFVIALAFACEQMTVEEAVMFSMGVLCSPLAGGERRLPSKNDAVTIFDASLLPYTLDLSAKEMRRRVMDLFHGVPLAPEHGMDILVFRRRFASGNFGFWFVHGASQVAHRTPPQAISASTNVIMPPHAAGIAGGGDSADGGASGRHHHYLAAGTTSEFQQYTTAAVVDDPEWLRFIIRVAKTKLGFAVTAHKDDTFAHVSAMIEATVEVPCAKQRFTLRGERVDASTAVGALVPPGILPQTEFVLSEISDLMNIVVVWRSREKKYDMRIAPNEKVLKLRAMLQQKTNIPLSRILLTYCNQQLWDRHSLEHYRLCDGCIIEVDAD